MRRRQYDLLEQEPSLATHLFDRDRCALAIVDRPRPMVMRRTRGENHRWNSAPRVRHKLEEEAARAYREACGLAFNQDPEEEPIVAAALRASRRWHYWWQQVEARSATEEGRLNERANN
jgi:hypothetical protein